MGQNDKERAFTKTAMGPCMEVRSFLWEVEDGMKIQFFPTKVPSAGYKVKDT